MFTLRKGISFVVSLLFIFAMMGFVPSNVFALSFDLIAPAGTLTRGQEVQFTITVDTENQSISSTQIGMTYKTDVLEYISTTPGDSFTTVNADNQEGGKIIFTGSNTDGFTGSGNFAVVTFKLIAQAAGSTELCVLFNPSSTTPTPAPQQTSAPLPTALPKSGSINQTAQGAVLGIALILVAGGSLVLIKKPLKKYCKYESSLHK